MIAFLMFAAAVAAPNCKALEASARPAIKRANTPFIKQLQAGDAEAIASAYADDGVFMGPDGAVVKGRAAVRELYAGAKTVAASVVGGGIHTDGMACSSDGMVYEWGTGTIETRGPNGKVSSRAGPYLTVWKRQSDGAWKITRNLSF